MRNFKDKIVDTLSAALSVKVVSDYPQSPEELPCVMVQVIRTSADSNSYDERLPAPRYSVSIQIDIYVAGKSAPIKVEDLFAQVDSQMQGMKFVLNDYAARDNIDRTISRGVARYSALVEPHYSGSDTTYQIFRR